MMHKKIINWVYIVLAISVGLIITMIDSSPSWDDTGITAVMIFCSCAFLGIISPRRPWAWALLVGIWIPLYGFIQIHNYGSILALVIALAGAYAGAISKRFIMNH